jgi:ABC-type transporter lipoprotein component MlaA
MTQDPYAEFNQAVRELGNTLAEALHLPQLVGWLNRRLTWRP